MRVQHGKVARDPVYLTSIKTVLVLTLAMMLVLALVLVLLLMLGLCSEDSWRKP